MKLIFTVILLALLQLGFAQEDYLMQDAITKPALSLRCTEMLRERDKKINKILGI
jgi:hypothetical protein